MLSSEGKLEWFNGNEDALRLYRMFVEVAHTWDDLIDHDKPVSNERINHAFFLTLVAIPSNPIFVKYGTALQPLLMNACVGYGVANVLESAKEEHGLEISHTLRYAVSGVFVFLITMLNGVERAQGILAEALKEMIPERYSAYLAEHQERPNEPAA